MSLEGATTMKIKRRKGIEAGVIAKDTIAGTEYEFRVGNFSDPETPQMEYEIQMRRAGSNAEWEPAMVGQATSKKDAMRFLANRYDRIGKDIKGLQVFDDTLQGYVDKEIEANKQKEAEAKQEVVDKEQQRETDLKKQERILENEADISESMKKAKAKKKVIKLKTKPGATEPNPEISALIFGDFAYHKMLRSKDKYTVTHIPSGKSVCSKLSSNESRELAYRFSLIPEKWAGKGKLPKGFEQAAMGTIMRFRGRELIDKPHPAMFGL